MSREWCGVVVGALRVPCETFLANLATTVDTEDRRPDSYLKQVLAPVSPESSVVESAILQRTLGTNE